MFIFTRTKRFCRRIFHRRLNNVLQKLSPFQFIATNLLLAVQSQPRRNVAHLVERDYTRFSHIFSRTRELVGDGWGCKSSSLFELTFVRLFTRENYHKINLLELEKGENK